MENHRLKALVAAVLISLSGILFAYEYNMENAVITSIASVSAPDLEAIESILASQKELLTRYFRLPIAAKPVVQISGSVNDFLITSIGDWHFGGVYQNGKIGLQPMSVLRQKRSLETVLRHEYTHFYFDRLFSSLPYFLHEGLATYFGGLALDRVSPILPDKFFRWEKEIPSGGLPEIGKVRAFYSVSRYFIMDVMEQGGRNGLLALLTNTSDQIRRSYRNYYENNSLWIKVLFNPRGESRFQIDFSGVCTASVTGTDGKVTNMPMSNSLFVDVQEGKLYLNDNPVNGAYLMFDDGFSSGDRSFRKDLQVQMQGTNLVLVNVLPVEYYLYSVVGGEMPTEKSEALKTQAVLSRSLAYYEIRKRTASDLWDVSPLTDDQSYRGRNWETENSRRAVENTEHEVMTWDGRLIYPYFSSTCSGWTADAKDVWGNTLPYAQAVKCAAGKTNLCDISPHFGEWNRSMTPGEISNAFGFAVTSIQTVSSDPHGRVSAVTVNGQNMTFDKFKSVLAAGSTNGWAFLKSNLFTVTNMADGGWTFNGRGLGHGVGLCQYGAIRLADTMNYTNILKFYFLKVSVEHYRPDLALTGKE